jgi:hypothetical protein
VSELYRNAFMTLVEDEDTLSFVWQTEEPDDAHATETARHVGDVLGALAAANAGKRYRVMIDLGPVQRIFPRALATYAKSLVVYRASIRRGAFVSQRAVLRVAVSSAFLVPGLSMKGFADLTEARAFVAQGSCS